VIVAILVTLLLTIYLLYLIVVASFKKSIFLKMQSNIFTDDRTWLKIIRGGGYGWNKMDFGR
jgi:hypothetical protein